MKDYKICLAGDSAVTVDFGNIIEEKVNRKVVSLQTAIDKKKIKGVREMIPTFRSLTVFYDPSVISYDKLVEVIEELTGAEGTASTDKKKVYKIPVCYESAFSLDIENVMAHTGLSREEIIERHTSQDYLIYMMGFLPGFAYLGGLDPKLETPRLSSPRTKIEAGSVGIGGNQTGIYPLASPGGWQLIGRTPVKPYDVDREKSILYEAGSYIRFYAITEEEYWTIKEKCDAGTYECQIEEV